MSDKVEPIKITTEVGRFTAVNLFIRDKFDEKSAPVYNAELALDPADMFGDDSAFEEALFQFMCQEWDDGEEAFNDSNFRDPRLDGAKLQKKREDKGKDGNAYAGKTVIRAKTKFNKNGEDAEGGAAVHHPDTSLMNFDESAEVYGGMEGCMAVTFYGWEQDRDDGATRHAVSLYLVAVQKTGKGERLATQQDTAGNFSAVAKKGGTRQRRKG